MGAEKAIRQASSRTLREEQVRRDIERFKEKAIELGASAAETIPASSVVIEERVRMKCLVPRCGALRDGGTPYCPPNSPGLEFTRKVISQYRWAVVFKRDVRLVADYTFTTEEARRAARSQTQKGPRKPGFHDDTHRIVNRLESYIQSQGYDLALGLSGGSCKVNLCHGAPCTAIQSGNCRFPLEARPSLEAMGIDVFDLANKVGWDVYMIRGLEPDPDEIPCGISVGIVFVY